MYRSRPRRVTYRPRNVSVTRTPVIVVVCGAGVSFALASFQFPQCGQGAVSGVV
jgi:hypothetical protein